MAKTYTVTAAVAVVRDEAGKIRYYYQGAVLPRDLPSDELTRLADAGLLGVEDDLVARTSEEVEVAPSTTVSSSPPVDPGAAPKLKK